MTVDDLPAGAREADRLGEQLLPGYRPSKIIEHKFLVDGWEHVEHGHTQCPEVRFWKTVTENRWFAILMITECQRDEISEKFDQLTIDSDYYPGLITHLNTGYVSDDNLVELDQMGAAFTTWSSMRVRDVMAAIPDEADGNSISKTLLWEGFQAGLMFAQQLEHPHG